MADFLIIDVGGANLKVEVQQQGASKRKDRSGTDISPAYSGKDMVTQTYPDRRILPFTSGPLTTNELVALEAAAQWPKAISVGGPALRITDNNAVPQTMTARVDVSEADYMAVGTDFIHIARIVVEESL